MYYGRKTKSEKAVQPPLFTNFSRLSLIDLRKIHRSKIKYDEAMEKYRIDSEEIDKYNNKIRADYKKEKDWFTRWRKTNTDPIEEKIEKISARLRMQQSSSISKFFGQQSIMFDGLHLIKNTETLGLLGEYNAAKKQLADAYSVMPRSHFSERDPDYKKYPNKPMGERSFTVGGTKVVIDLTYMDLEDINSLILAKELEASMEKEKINELKARVSKNERETRQLAKKYQSDFMAQKKIISECPYCGGSLNNSDSHLDHIYPVSKGGHSVKRNLVFVCSTCNLKKKNHTLRSFLISAEFSELVVYERLEKLGKDF